MDKKYQALAEDMSIKTPCTPEEAKERVRRATLMALTTIYRLNTFIELERQMCLRGIDFSGCTTDDFYVDNLKLQLTGMVFR